MKLVKSDFRFENLPSREAVLSHIELAGRTCYQSEPKGDPGKFVSMVIARGHESVLEHISFSCRVICDRGVSHEIVRHRLASYSQESTRYCCYKDEVTFIDPNEMKLGDADTVEILNAYHEAERSYLLLIRNGTSPQMARAVLPNGLKTEIVVTMNVREWRHFFKMRNAKPAHPQMRSLAFMMHEELYNKYPELFSEFTMSEQC